MRAPRPLDVPVVVRNKAEAVGALSWLAGLPSLVAELEAEWSLSVGRTYQDGTEAFVAEATTEDGTLAVLKLMVPRPGNAAAHEITTLSLAAGEGCALLLRSDVDRGALLVERLGPTLHDLGLPIERRHQILCDAAAKVWRPAPDCGLPDGAAKGHMLIEMVHRLWAELDRPCSERAVDHAVACATRRIAAHDAERARLVHGDVHEWNALQSGDGFKLVDPDGLLAEPEYDLGVMMREDPAELMHGDPWDRARSLAAHTGLDATAIWEWGVIERVSTGLLCTRVGLQPFGVQMLAAADHIAEHHR